MSADDMSSDETPNPYRSPSPVQHQGVVYGDYAKRRRGGFLFREIELTGRFDGVLRYTGWWFVQRVFLNDRRLWWKISWLTLQRRVDFRLPDATGQAVDATLQMDFDARLRFRRFQLIADDVSIYDEIV